jgi:FAD dependent oxidoreductase
MNRRLFLLGSAASIATVAVAAEVRELAVDVAIIGGGLGGVAAAIGACRGGAKKVVLTEETIWIGGQLTSQLVPPDEHKFIEGGGSTKSYQDLRNVIREVYRTRKDKPLTAAAKAIKNLNPGNGWVSRLCHEPTVALGVMEALLKPYIASGQLILLKQTKPVRAEVKGDDVQAVTVQNADGKQTTITAKFFLDATEEGDLLPMTKTEFVTGTESQKETGEPNAADKPRPGNIQSFTWCAVLEHRPGEEHIIEKPKDYDFWKKQTYDKAPVFQWEKPAYSFHPLAEKDPKQPKLMNFWTYRRIIARNQFTPGSYPGDVSVINYHQNDYALGSSHYGKPEECAKHLAAAKELTRCFIHWLQTESPRSDGKTGWPDLKPGADFTGTPEGIAMSAYIRESRRIVPEFRILQQHVSYDLKIKELGKEKARAEEYKDSIGVGHYLYFDLHKTCEGYSNGGGGKVFPFQIPLGAIIPQRVTNLLAACKNLGVTHITNGCYRLHPTEWNIGESAGALAAYCLAKSVTPKQVRNTPATLADYQTTLTKAGVQLEWPANQAQDA